MFKALALVLCLFSAPAWADNLTCPTRPVGDNTNACASTAFVIANASAGSGITTLTGDVTAGPGSGSQAASVVAIRGTAVTALNSGVATALGSALSTNGGFASTIARGSTALGTGAISSATCATVVTTSATNTLTTDVITASFNGDPTAVTGYVPSTSGMLTIFTYPTANNVNFKVCNNTSGSITPGAITLNWRVAR